MKTRTSSHKIYIAVSLLLFFVLTGFNRKEYKRKSILNMVKIPGLQTGDIVLRDSKGLLASLFRKMSLKEKKYSHAGFIVKVNKHSYVYHFIDAEKNSGLSIDKLEDFAGNAACNSFVVYRPDYSSTQKKEIEDIIKDPENSNKTFDVDFNLKSDESLYCTEWIYKCLLATGFHPPVTKTCTAEYIAPDNLYLNNFVKRIAYVNYKPDQK
ncbi:MAG: YiiX/YebB-like N1pC/P60 family cysteine hydrolase [Bacteroidota bacterium]